MFGWLATRWSNRNRLQTQAPHLQAVAAHHQAIWPNLTQTAAQSNVYAASPWVYVAVNRIAEAGALAPLQVYRIEGEQRIGVTQHPLEKLLEAPNPFMSRFELFEQTLGMLELTGNAYWFLVGDAAGTPAQIWPLRPDRVSIAPDATQYVQGYIYEIDGKRIPLEAIEVIHFKRWHPANDYYGLSALEAARVAIHTDQAMGEWNRNTFGVDHGVPAGIVQIKERVSDADYERIKREWRSSYGGPQRRTAFLRGGDIEWRNIGLSHSELDFLQGRKANRDEILNIFGVPVGLVSENATEANAKVAERLFVERALWPKLVRIAQKITQELLPFWPGYHVAEFADIRPTDIQARLAEIRAAYPVLSINEIRARYYQLPSVDWGERPVGARMEKTEKVEPIAAPADPTPEAKPGETAAAPAAAKTALAELAQWERFALKRWGRAGARAFTATAIPDPVVFEITAGLAAAGNVDEARLVFQNARPLLAEGELPGEGGITQAK